MRRREEEITESASSGTDRWMLTYLDMITLLMAFFCILFAFAQVDAVKFRQVAQSMSMAFGAGGGAGQNVITNYSGTGIIPQISSNSLIALRENNQFKSIIKLIRDYAATQGLKQVRTKITERGLELSLPESVLFESGKADLSSKSREVLDRLAEILFKLNTVIRVEGHTDSVPIHTVKYESNWQLSTDRATNVIMYWISKYPSQSSNLSAAGYGEYHPLDTNNTYEGKAKNRRVEIIVLRQSEAKKERQP
jgi:chemotaxis protein MotB